MRTGRRDSGRKHGRDGMDNGSFQTMPTAACGRKRASERLQPLPVKRENDARSGCCRRIQGSSQRSFLRGLWVDVNGVASNDCSVVHA